MSSSFAFIEIYSHNLHNNKKSQFGLGFKFFFYKLYYGFDILWWACRLNISKLIYIYIGHIIEKKNVYFLLGAKPISPVGWKLGPRGKGNP